MFWANQAMCLSKHDPDDVLRLAECFVLQKQFHRALQLIRNHRLQVTGVRGCYLAAKAAYESGDQETAITLMELGSAFIEEAKQALLLKANPPATPATSKSGQTWEIEIDQILDATAQIVWI